MILLLLTACVQTVRFPPDLWVWDTGAWDTAEWEQRPEAATLDPSVDESTLRGGCVPSNDYWQISFRTTAWAERATVDLFVDESDWTETHPLHLMDSSPSGLWDEYQSALRDQTPVEDVVPGTSSAFDCEGDRAAITYVVRVYDRFNQLSDCAVWGHELDDADPLITTLPPNSCRWLDLN